MFPQVDVDNQTDDTTFCLWWGVVYRKNCPGSTVDLSQGQHTLQTVAILCQNTTVFYAEI